MLVCLSVYVSFSMTGMRVFKHTRMSNMITKPCICLCLYETLNYKGVGYHVSRKTFSSWTTFAIFAWHLCRGGFQDIHGTYPSLNKISYNFMNYIMMNKRVCLSVYVWFSMTGRGFSNIHATCLFREIVASIYGWCLLSMYVCWKVTYMHAWRHTYLPKSSKKNA